MDGLGYTFLNKQVAEEFKVQCHNCGIALRLELEKSGCGTEMLLLYPDAEESLSKDLEDKVESIYQSLLSRPIKVARKKNKPQGLMVDVSISSGQTRSVLIDQNMVQQLQNGLSLEEIEFFVQKIYRDIQSTNLIPIKPLRSQ